MQYPDENALAEQRDRMVDNQIEARGIGNPHLLAAMREVPREAFVPPEIRDQAYADRPLPIGSEQTISQPYIVAMMIDAAGIEPGQRVLDIGTGSGYAAAVMSRIAQKVYSIERYRELALRARDAIDGLGYENVEIAVGDGSRGWPEEAPFDAILIAAGGPKPPRALLEQLAPGGVLVMPVGAERGYQEMTRISNHDGDFVQENIGAVAFVPLVGEGGWQEDGRQEIEGKKISLERLPSALDGSKHTN